ncbi:serine/threonine-protein kinase [Mycoplasma leonicaptivi]|uniref:serine/threonine-protein kinase n=1 Tax=Mycoplasma leonicaptivi TaxID=36742 RepID=UPI0004893C10|nr:serine/threonine-protein kinase [Mycoplasma leonicaptivi]
MNKFNIPLDSTVYKIFDIIKILGTGGMGYVYLVKFKNPKFSDNTYALKYCINDQNDNNKKRFIHEIQLLKKINSKYFPKIHYDYLSENEQFFVMDYIDGETLNTYLEKNFRLSVKLSNHLIKQIASAIDVLHDLGIIHCDIKSQNIMIDNAYNIKLLDLGISITENDNTTKKENVIVCSPYYSAPEYTYKNTKITKMVDIYALGIVYFEILTGTYPFKYDLENETILAHRDKKFPNPKNFRDLPQSVCNIILKATAKKPSDRYINIEEFKKDISTSLNEDRKLEKPLNIKTLKTKKGIVKLINSIYFLIFIIILVLVIFLITLFFFSKIGVI